jgi:hypothetical protein
MEKTLRKMKTYDVYSPGRIFPVLDGLEQGLGSIIWVFAGKPARFCISEGLHVNNQQKKG